MMRKLVMLAAVAVLLTGCAPTLESVSDKCGGETAGIGLKEDGLQYHQDNDSTGAAWKCVLSELVPEEADQYAITQDMTPGETGTKSLGDKNLVYGVTEDGAVMLVVLDKD